MPARRCQTVYLDARRWYDQATNLVDHRGAETSEQWTVSHNAAVHVLRDLIGHGRWKLSHHVLLIEIDLIFEPVHEVGPDSCLSIFW